jgi:hypothetical protein
VDARAGYVAGLDGERWSVMLSDQPEGVPSHLSLEITSPLDNRYAELVGNLEGLLGHSALTIFVY